MPLIDKDNTPICDYYGLLCLDKLELIFPDATILQPWHDSSEATHCDCMPSCTENEITIINEERRFEF